MAFQQCWVKTVHALPIGSPIHVQLPQHSLDGSKGQDDWRKVRPKSLISKSDRLTLWMVWCDLPKAVNSIMVSYHHIVMASQCDGITMVTDKIERLKWCIYWHCKHYYNSQLAENNNHCEVHGLKMYKGDSMRKHLQHKVQCCKKTLYHQEKNTLYQEVHLLTTCLCICDAIHFYFQNYSHFYIS